MTKSSTIPTKKLSKANVAKAERILTDRGYGGSMLQYVTPSGNENVALMLQVLRYAWAERALARRQKRRSRFQMNSWTQGVVVKNADGSPPPMSCGTSACLAGTAAAFTMAPNEVIAYNGDIFELSEQQAERIRKTPRNLREHLLRGVPCKASARARGGDELGLNSSQRDVLFYMPDNLEDIVLVASYIVGVDLTKAVQR